MPNSCSSDIPNGCAGCGPSLSLWQISSQQSLNKTDHGYACLNNSAPKRYLNSDANYRQQFSSNSDCQKDTGNNRTGSYTRRYKFYVSQYGDIFGYEATTFNYTDNLLQVDPCICYRGTLQASEETTTDAMFNCNNGNPFMQSFSKSNCPFYDNWGYSGSPGECGDDYSGYSNNTDYCIGQMIYPGAEDATSCTQSNKEESTTNRCCGPFESCYVRCNDSLITDVTLSAELTLRQLFSICKQVTSIKINKYKTNLAYSCNGTKCGTGKEDDCWAEASSFSITDNNLDDPNANSTTSQKLKFKVAVLKEGFQKIYQRISGKVTFYYGGTGGKTPCCNDDFDGTIVEQVGYSFSPNSSTFKDDYFAIDCGEFDNSDQTLVGQTIGICYTVDNISFF